MSSSFPHFLRICVRPNRQTRADVVVRPVHVAVTEYPTADWVAQQLLEAFPWDSAPLYLLRDRDGSYGEKFHQATSWLGIREVLTAPQSPWQNPYVERLLKNPTGKWATNGVTGESRYYEPHLWLADLSASEP